MESNTLSPVQSAQSAIEKCFNKKQIEAMAQQMVESEMEEGFADPIIELVSATKLAAFFAARVSALRSHALEELKGEKEMSALGSKVQKSVEPSRWEYEDSYLEELKNEIKLVQDKAQQSEERNRHHITLSGESIIIQRGIKKMGGETVKVIL